jgi:hypothetical protein
MRTAACLLAAVLLTACASGGDLASHNLDIADIEQRMGQPVMRWHEADGGETLVYPEGAQGYRTWFVRSDASGRVIARKNVLAAEQFAKIQPQMSEEEVLHLLGPPVPHWTTYFKARDELVWEWRYCNDWNEPARFDVMFDATTRRVRSTYAASEDLRGLQGFFRFRNWCGH